MYKNISKIIVIIFLASVMSCQSEKEPFNEEEYVNSVQAWQTKRLERLKAENGWLNLVGLHWLKDGQNPFGSNEANNIIFPENAPEFIGTIILYKGNLSISIDKDVEVFINDSLLKESDIITDADKGKTQFKMGDFRWHIIKRGDRYGIRLRDINSPLVKQITEVPSFPINSKWRLEAKFEKFDTPKEIAVPNVLGNTEFEQCYGLLKFEIDGVKHSLMPLGNGSSSFFVIFADESSAEETYGAGRFLSVEKPDEKGNTIIDFNKATNPPCAFTDFATCPLPPKENILSIEILAGEKINEHFGHH